MTEPRNGSARLSVPNDLFDRANWCGKLHAGHFWAEVGATSNRWRAAGFEVTEDLSVVDRQVGGSPAKQLVREAEGQAHASAIRLRAEMLMAADAEVARMLAAATDRLDRLEFSDTANSPREKLVVRAVDYAPMPDAPIKDPGMPDNPVGKGPDQLALRSGR